MRRSTSKLIITSILILLLFFSFSPTSDAANIKDQLIIAASGPLGGTLAAYQFAQDIWSWLSPGTAPPSLSEAAPAAGKKVVQVGMGVVLDVTATFIQLILIPVASGVFFLSSWVLDESIRFTLNSANLGGSLGTGPTGITMAIELASQLIRNLFNVTFIFILLWLSIKTIVGLDEGKTKKTIADVVVAALLINFSLFLTRIVIDVGNLLSLPLYEVATTGAGGVGTGLMNSLGLQTFWKEATINYEFGSPVFFIISFIQLFVLTTSIIGFFYAGLMMVTRTVSLIFIMIISPIGFMGKILPSIADHAKKWRENLYGFTFMAPIFLLFVTIIRILANQFNVAIVESSEKYAGGIALSIGENINPTHLLIYFKYVLIIVLLFTAIKTTKKMSGDIGGFVEKIGTAAAGIAIGAASGGAALLGRQTLGRIAANQLAGEKGAALRARAATGDLGARMALSTYERGASASFDARNSKVLSGAGSLVADKFGVKVNAGKAGGLSSMVGMDKTVTQFRDDQQKKENQIYNDLEKSVTNKQRLEANSAIQKRNATVETLLSTNAEHTNLKSKKDDLTNVDVQYATGTKQRKEIEDLRTNAYDAEQEHRRLVANGADQKDIAAAKRVWQDEERKVQTKQKELQEELKKKYAGELAEIEDQMKVVRTKTERDVESGMTEDERNKINIVNRARNYAESVRRGRKFSMSYINSPERRAELANRMENQRT